jgi:hypothetical protein
VFEKEYLNDSISPQSDASVFSSASFKASLIRKPVGPRQKRNFECAKRRFYQARQSSDFEAAYEAPRESKIMRLETVGYTGSLEKRRERSRLFCLAELRHRAARSMDIILRTFGRRWLGNRHEENSSLPQHKPICEYAGRNKATGVSTAAPRALTQPQKPRTRTKFRKLPFLLAARILFVPCPRLL